MSDILFEAFKSMSMFDDIDTTEAEEVKNVYSTSPEDLELLKELIDGDTSDKDDDIVSAISLNMEFDEDAVKADSHIGDTILKCEVCDSLSFIKPDEIIRKEDTDDIVNKDLECPNCGNAAGYTIVGTVVEDEEGEAVVAEPAEEDTGDIDFDIDTVDIDDIDVPEEISAEDDAIEETDTTDTEEVNLADEADENIEATGDDTEEVEESDEADEAEEVDEVTEDFSEKSFSAKDYAEEVVDNFEDITGVSIKDVFGSGEEIFDDEVIDDTADTIKAYLVDKGLSEHEIDDILYVIDDVLTNRREVILQERLQEKSVRGRGKTSNVRIIKDKKKFLNNVEDYFTAVQSLLGDVGSESIRQSRPETVYADTAQGVNFDKSGYSSITVNADEDNDLTFARAVADTLGLKHDTVEKTYPDGSTFYQIRIHIPDSKVGEDFAKYVDLFTIENKEEPQEDLLSAANEALNEANATLTKDLSTVETSMTSILNSNIDKINKATNKFELANILTNLFDEHDLNTAATNRLLGSVLKAKSNDDALQAVYNSILKGSKLGVIESTCKEKDDESKSINEDIKSAFANNIDQDIISALNSEIPEKPILGGMVKCGKSAALNALYYVSQGEEVKFNLGNIKLPMRQITHCWVEHNGEVAQTGNDGLDLITKFSIDLVPNDVEKSKQLIIDEINKINGLNESKSIKEDRQSDILTIKSNIKDNLVLDNYMGTGKSHYQDYQIELFHDSDNYGGYPWCYVISKDSNILTKKCYDEDLSNTLYSIAQFIYNTESKSIEEDINNLSLDTDDTHMEMTSDDEGKVTITTEPIEKEKDEAEELDDCSFTEIAEHYLKACIENVEKFTINECIGSINKAIKVNGIIKLAGETEKPTSFFLEKKANGLYECACKDTIADKGKFNIKASISENKLICEAYKISK